MRANGSGGSSTPVISSPGRKLGLDLGMLAGQAVEVDEAASSARRPVRRDAPSASSAASATHMSDGCVATQAGEAPRMAWMRLKPSIASQPWPGSRLLQREPSSS